MSLSLGSERIFIFLLILWYGGLACSADSSSFMSSVLANLFEDFGSKRSSTSEKEDTTERTKKYAIRRRVLKVIATTVEEETDCRSRGGSPCVRDEQCCLGKCSPKLGRCPTAAELFDAAVITIKQERDKRIVKRRNDTLQPHHVVTNSPPHRYNN